MAKAKTPSFILEFGLETNAHEEAELNKRFEAARQLYNACLDEAKRRLFLLRQSKEYKEARSMPRTENGKSRFSGSRKAGQNSKRTEAFKALNTRFGFTEYDLHAYATKIRNSWIGNHLDSQAAQKLATRSFKAVQRVAFGQAKKVRFKGKNQLKSVEGKTNKTGIRYQEKTGHIEWNGLKLKCIISVNDEVVVHGLSCPVKYCRIVKRIFNGKVRFFVQLILEGKPFIKEKNETKDKIVGLDIGPSTIAYVRKAHQRQRLMVSDEHASLERFCDEIKNKQKEIRRLQRSLERKRRANNPQNYNPLGTIKKGKKTWHDSSRYVKTKTKLAELQRKLSAHRKSLHGNLANRILKQGKHIKTEKLSYRAFQRSYGKSVKDRAPSMFVEILRRKAENAGGSVDEFSTKTTKLSQYCHKCGKYKEKPLSQRWHTCCGLNIQRDLYSAFLAMGIVENKLDTADVIKRWRSTEAVLQQAVSEVKSPYPLLPPFLKGVGGLGKGESKVANGRQLPSSFGLCRSKTPTQVRVRATRLRSSDVLERGIPDAKDRDVVA